MSCVCAVLFVQVGYLQRDCNDAMAKMRGALRKEHTHADAGTAPIEAITLGGRGGKRGGAAGGIPAGGITLDAAAAQDYYWEEVALLCGDQMGGNGEEGLGLAGGNLELGLAPSGSQMLSQVRSRGGGVWGVVGFRVWVS